MTYWHITSWYAMTRDTDYFVVILQKSQCAGLSAELHEERIFLNVKGRFHLIPAVAGLGKWMQTKILHAIVFTWQRV